MNFVSMFTLAEEVFSAIETVYPATPKVAAAQAVAAVVGKAVVAAQTQASGTAPVISAPVVAVSSVLEEMMRIVQTLRQPTAAAGTPATTPR